LLLQNHDARLMRFQSLRNVLMTPTDGQDESPLRLKPKINNDERRNNIGASFTRKMRDAAALSIVVYLVAWWALSDPFGLQGLWGAMIIYVVARAVALLLFYPPLRRSAGR
jgi:hypothetical protein